MASPDDPVCYSTSANQKRMYILNQLSPDGTEYNVPWAFRLEGKLDVQRLREALSALVLRHACLRTSFKIVEEDVIQQIEQPAPIRLPCYTAKTKAGIEEINNAFVRPFDLHRAPLFRICLISIESRDHILLLDMHHIICDGVSVDILFKELGQLYGGLALKELSCEYKDFALWQRDFAKTAQAKRQEEYWMGLLSGDRPVLNLPTDYARKNQPSFDGDRVFARPGKILSSTLRAFVAKHRISMYMFMLAAYYVLLSKYTDQEDIVVGTMVSGRRGEKFQDVVGIFVNTLLLRSQPRGRLAFAEYLKQVRGECLDAFENQDYQFEDLVDKIRPSRDLGRSPLVDTMFGVLSCAETPISQGGVSFSRYELDYKISKFDLSLTAIEQQNQELVLEFEYSTGLFRKETIERLSSHYLNVLKEVLENPDIKLSDINILTVDERQRLVVSPVDQVEKTERAISVVELFRNQVCKDPEAPALSYGEHSLSYSELDKRSDQLAARLQRQCVGQADLIGVVAVPSFEMVIAVLGVLKLGAAYVPIDPTTPLPRFRNIVADSGITTLLIKGDSGHFTQPGVVNIRLDETPRCVGETLSVPTVINPDEPVYVIYTSGSTGTPKGVVVSHRALSNYVTWAVKTYINEERMSFALYSPLAVDLTVTSVFVPLISGGRIVIYQSDNAVGLIEEIVRDNQVQLIKLTPTHLSLLAELGRDVVVASKLRKIIVGGEDLKTSLAAKIYTNFGGRAEIFNEYGPTEATVGCMVYKYRPEIDTAISVPIGDAIDKTSVFILDKYNNPTPEGVAGELCIAGVCLARGYLNNPRLTDEKFVMIRLGSNHLRMYRTGDLARMLSHGQIEYLGRNDDQVKIRGFRIELGEIEATLQRLTQVKDVVVTKKADAAGDAYLCAYIVTDDEMSTTDLRMQLAEHLPEYMIPAWFVPLECFPTGRGGKIDKRTLPDPHEVIVNTNSYEAPRSGIEAGLAKIWEQVLGVRTIGIDDNFFELGGQSLKAAIMVARVNRDLAANISLRDVFIHPTARKLTSLVEQTWEDSRMVIESVIEQEYYPVSSAQKRLYLLNQMAPSEIQYNVPWVIRVTGQFDAARWEHAFCTLIDRHESLRTSFDLIDDEIVQKVYPQVRFALEYPTLTGAVNLQQEIERFVRPFDLSAAPLIRGAVIATESSTHMLIVNMHHIVSDGISVDIMFKDLCALYQGRPLEAVAIQYKDYASWHCAYLGTEAIQAQGEYWIKSFKGELPVLNLPTDFLRGAVQSFEGDHVTFGVGSETVKGLRSLNRDCGVTMHMTLLAAYTILLSKYTGQEDIIVGTPIAGRNHASLEGVVGMFVNTLPMRNQPRGELKFYEFLQMVKSNALDAYSNQEYPFEELVDKLEIKRDIARNPLFDTVFASLSNGHKKFEADGASIEELFDFDWNISKFDLTLLVAEQVEGLHFELEYCTKLFHRSTIERLGIHYKHILEQIALHPDKKIMGIELLSESERQQILGEFNQTEHDYTDDRSIHQCFEEQVDKWPGNVAVVDGEESHSYLELNQRANQIGRMLLSRGVDREEVVGIIAGASFEMIVGILGILKAGCAYLPIDRDGPENRVRAMLDDSGARIVLKAGGAEWQDATRLVLDLSDPGLYQGDDSNLDKVVGSGDLAYVIYTSGTTGVPKGVMIEHHSVNNLCAWHIDTFDISATDRATKYARFSFDASVWEIFPYLQAGAALHIIHESMLLDLPRLNRYFEQNSITIGFLPTQVCELFTELDNNSLRVLLTGGDRLRRVRPKNYRVVNNYGPTENTVVTTSCEVGSDPYRIPIGKPLFNTRVYLLGKSDELVPIGVPGELCIAGVGLARGYLNDIERTVDKFATNPFEPDTRMYRTGDLARWLPDGSIEFIGREDKQIKIRGSRTEPREIEAAIMTHELVKDAVVLVQEDGQGNNYLCAYIVWQNTTACDQLKPFLAKRLPDYMVPAFLFNIEHIPLNARGKIDTAALPQPGASPATRQEYVAPRNDTESRLAEIWCHVLDRERISVHDNFFDTGGNSLSATIMLAKANKVLAADVALGAVFDNPTIAALASCFENVEQHETIGLEHAESRMYYSVTPTQRLLYAVCVSRKGVEYNLPMAFELHGDLDVAKLEKVFQRMIRRHEVLRTSFQKVGEQTMQTVSPTVDFTIDILEECGEDEISEVARDFIRPFDLSRAPLMRVSLVPIVSGHHVLLMDVHHLVSDGTSMGIMFQEMAALYAGEEPQIPSLTFKDFAEWLNGYQQTRKVREQEKYWINVLSDPPPALILDTDFPRPENFSFVGNRISFKAAPEVYSALRHLCVQQCITLYMALLAAYNVLLSKYSGQEDIIVGVPTAGRYIADVQDMIGMFVSTHAVRCRPQAALRFEDFLQQVKTAVLGALEHQEYQLWDMMLTHMSQTGGKPLFSTVFVVQDQAFEAMEMPGLDVEEREVGYQVSKFDLTLGAVERSGGLEFELEYSTDLFRRSTVKRFAGHYLNILEQIVTEAGRNLQQLEIVTQAEKNKLLYEFNGGVAEYAADENVVRLFERQVYISPDRVAIVCDGDGITYRELNRRANQLARYLRGNGVEVDEIVGVMVTSSFEMVIAVLAVLKAGAAYLPLSQRMPRQRIERLLMDSGAKRLLCGSDIDETYFETEILDLGNKKNYDPDGSNLDPLEDAGRVAYVSFVVDGMGASKGVIIEHGSLLRRCQWFIEQFALTPDDRCAKYGDLSTSATLFELFPILCSGASICIIPDQTVRDVEHMNTCLEENGVTIGWLPAPICEHMASLENMNLRLLITSERNVGAVRRGGYELVFCYGSAENTEVTTCCTVHSQSMGVIVGKPITNSEVYIIGHDDGLQPIGVTGELCVAGAGLAGGGLGDQAASKRFTPNPHVVDGRMFRTGDSARWLSDGRVEVIGRIEQVIIDNHRVCLAEIERCLESHQSITEAAVVFMDDDPLRQRLVAFILLRGSLQVPPQLFVQALKTHLGQYLPDYMIPDTYIKVDMIPRDATGQIQYESLSIPDQRAAGDELSEAAIADKVSSIAEHILDVQQIGTTTDLCDLGMDSLKAMSLIAQINNAFGLALSIHQVLTTPTILAVSHNLSEIISSESRQFTTIGDI